jgi:hypothetical protein
LPKPFAPLPSIPPRPFLQLTQRPSWFWEKKKGSRMARYSRKVVTMNVFFVLLVAVQIIIVVGAAAGMLYYAAYSQLFRLANVVAEQVCIPASGWLGPCMTAVDWLQVEQGIIYELRNLFALPVAYCANTGGFFMHGVGAAEYDVVLHYLANNYISAMYAGATHPPRCAARAFPHTHRAPPRRMENLMMPNQLFAASAEGYFYAFGLSEDFYAQYRHDRSKRPSMADFEISLVTDPQAPDALVLYGVNGDCEVDDYTCSMVNLTDRRSSQPFDATVCKARCPFLPEGRPAHSFPVSGVPNAQPTPMTETAVVPIGGRDRGGGLDAHLHVRARHPRDIRGYGRGSRATPRRETLLM